MKWQIQWLAAYWNCFGCSNKSAVKTTPKILHIGDSSMFLNKVNSMLWNNALFIDSYCFKSLIKNLINSPGTCTTYLYPGMHTNVMYNLDTCNILLFFMLFKHLRCRAVESNCKTKRSTPNCYHSAKQVGGYPSQGALFHHHCADLEEVGGGGGQKNACMAIAAYYEWDVIIGYHLKYKNEPPCKMKKSWSTLHITKIFNLFGNLLLCKAFSYSGWKDNTYS